MKQCNPIRSFYSLFLLTTKSTLSKSIVLTIVLVAVLHLSALASDGVSVAGVHRVAISHETAVIDAKGTSQLLTDWCKVKKTYTLGAKDNWPIKFCLISAEYRSVHIDANNECDYPEQGEKLLIVHYSLQNPLTLAVPNASGDVNITAVGEKGANYHESYRCLEKSRLESTGLTPQASIANYEGNASIRLASTGFYHRLEPGQKIYAYSIIHVSGDEFITKLIVAHSSDLPDARYDMHGLITPLVPPYNSPVSNAKPWSTFAGAAGMTYGSASADLKCDGTITFSDTLFPNETKSNLSHYALCSFTITNFAPSFLTPLDVALQLKDGNNVVYSEYAVLSTGSNQIINPHIDTHGSLTFREAYWIPRSVTIQTVSMRLMQGYTFILNASSDNSQ